MRDLAHAHKIRVGRRHFEFSAEQATHVCRFIEKLPHVEGNWSTPTIVLDPFQVFLLVQLFGFRRLDGRRRFTTLLFLVGRKNAKSTLCAAILLYVLCFEHEAGPQVVSAATTGDQARIVWNVAARMVRASAGLRRSRRVEAFSKSIVRYTNGGTFKPINAKASTQDGLNPSAFCCDELHAHKTHDLLNVLTSAAGARENPLYLYATTEGYETPGPWPEERHFAEQVLKGLITADHYLAIMYALDDKDEDFDESRWPKANPLARANPNLFEAIRKEAIEAREKPGKLVEFRIKRLNRRSSSATAWVNLTKWRRCGGPVDLAWLEGKPCVGAFDLASTTDMNAWALAWLVEGRYFLHVRYWVPADAVVQRTERNTVPYAAWVERGLIMRTEGEVSDYTRIRADILADFRRFSPTAIAFDPWNAGQLSQDLLTEGLPLRQFIQGPKSYHPAMQAFEMAYTSGLINHGSNPVLDWNMANLVARYDQNLNMAPDKRRSPEKIDGAVAVLMAFGLLATPDDSAAFDAYLANPVRG